MGKAAFSATGAAIRLVRRAISALGVWMLPLIVGVLVAAALTGGLSLHRGAGTTPDQTTALGERPFMNISLYYTPDYINVVTAAHERGDDILSSFQSLDSAWKAVCPTEPLTIKVISSPLPEPITKRAVAPILAVTEVVNEATFKELRGLLEDLRSLIVDGDGSGRGQLDRCGYQAQPTGPGMDSSSDAEKPDHSGVRRGPARLAQPATAL
jgi:hypothetical protein